MAIRHLLLHDSLGDIADDFQVAKTVVRDAIWPRPGGRTSSSILDPSLFPEERLVARQFKPIFSALRSFMLGAPVRTGNLSAHAFRALIQPYGSAKIRSRQFSRRPLDKETAKHAELFPELVDDSHDETCKTTLLKTMRPAEPAPAKTA